MANQWFRFYHEWDSDPKVQSMSEAMQRRLAMLFCSKCRGETLQEQERAFHWRISENELAETKAVFMQKGFIDKNWDLVNWNRRQFLSDSSTDRVRRHRQAKKQFETLHETVVPVTVTAPDTDTDTEAEIQILLPEPKYRLPATGKKFYNVPDDQIRQWSELYPAVNVEQELRAMIGWLDANPTKRKTMSGMKRFINSWLSKAQNNGGSNGKGSSFSFAQHSKTSGNFPAAAAALRYLAGQEPDISSDGETGECITGHFDSVRK